MQVKELQTPQSIAALCTKAVQRKGHTINTTSTNIRMTADGNQHMHPPQPLLQNNATACGALVSPLLPLLWKMPQVRAVIVIAA